MRTAQERESEGVAVALANLKIFRNGLNTSTVFPVAIGFKMKVMIVRLISVTSKPEFVFTLLFFLVRSNEGGAIFAGHTKGYRQWQHSVFHGPIPPNFLILPPCLPLNWQEHTIYSYAVLSPNTGS